MLHDNNLIKVSLRLKKSEPLFRTIRELPGIGRSPRTRDDIRLRRNLQLSFKVVRQKPTQTFIFRILLAMSLDFHLQHRRLEEKSSMIITGAKLFIEQKRLIKTSLVVPFKLQ